MEASGSQGQQKVLKLSMYYSPSDENPVDVNRQYVEIDDNIIIGKTFPYSLNDESVHERQIGITYNNIDKEWEIESLVYDSTPTFPLYKLLANKVEILYNQRIMCGFTTIQFLYSSAEKLVSIVYTINNDPPQKCERLALNVEYSIGKVGNSSYQNIIINDSTISKQHATVTFKESNILVCDKGSTNFTWIEFGKIQFLGNCISIRLGKNTFTKLERKKIDAKRSPQYIKEIFAKAIKPQSVPSSLEYDKTDKIIATVSQKLMEYAKGNSDLANFTKVDADFISKVSKYNYGDAIKLLEAARAQPSIGITTIVKKYGHSEFIGKVAYHSTTGTQRNKSINRVLNFIENITLTNSSKE